jgi:hypothetical protein
MNRRGFLLGLGAGLVASRAIVRAASLMPVRGIVMDAWPPYGASPAMLATAELRAALAQAMSDFAAFGSCELFVPFGALFTPEAATSPAHSA